jgi:hypothetical protein
MGTLADQFFALDADGRRAVHLQLCRNALRVWEAYAAQHAPITYHDSVVGMHHVVEVDLPAAALACAERGERGDSIEYRYREPIVALQDDDLEFPPEIEFAYYAVYNLFRTYCRGITIDDWLIVNQALAAEDSTERGAALLRDAIQNRPST